VLENIVTLTYRKQRVSPCIFSDHKRMVSVR
jgi:hypothetical protein